MSYYGFLVIAILNPDVIFLVGGRKLQLPQSQIIHNEQKLAFTNGAHYWPAPAVLPWPSFIRFEYKPVHI